jgi:2-keto-4-pentenoate hydratase/2-oxohepta-3-ene-1,7-dioic acid hydratase in catechol pathway
VVGSDQPIERPRVSEQLDYEGELVIVIGIEAVIFLVSRLGPMFSA